MINRDIIEYAKRSYLRGQGVKKSIAPNDISFFKNSIWKSLSDSTRQGILFVLGKEHSLCVNELAAHFNVSRSTVSHHLNVLKDAQVVRAQKVGKEIYYSLNKRFIRRSVQSLLLIIDSMDDNQNNQENQRSNHEYSGIS